MTNWWEAFMEHDGLILRERVLADVDPDQLLVALRSGRVRRVQRGIYIPRNIEYWPLTAARAAVLSSGIPDAVASHRTAGRLHELELPREKRCEDVTVARERRRKDRKDLCFHTRGLTVGDVQVHHGIPITVLSRTLADLACSLDRLPAVWMLDDAFRRGLSSGDAVARAVCRWRGGADCAAAVKRLTEADGVAESILETAGRLAILDAGLPLPVPQYKVYTPSGRLIARLDGAYPNLKLGLEFDGQATHGSARAVLHDRERQNALLALGWTVLRFTWWDVTRDAGRFVSMVRELSQAG